MAHPAGFEPATFCSGGKRAIRLRHGCLTDEDTSLSTGVFQPHLGFLVQCSTDDIPGWMAGTQHQFFDSKVLLE